MRICHDEVGHVGPEKTTNLISKTYFPRMQARVKDYISNCVKCLTYSVSTGRIEGKLHIYEKDIKPFETLHIDHYAPLEKVGRKSKKYIFIVIEAFIKYTVIYPVKSTSMKEVIACLKEYFHHFGICRRIVSDRGSFFVSDEFACYLKQLNVKHVKVASPQSNGQVKRVNRFLRSILSKLSAEGK